MDKKQSTLMALAALAVVFGAVIFLVAQGAVSNQISMQDSREGGNRDTKTEEQKHLKLPVPQPLVDQCPDLAGNIGGTGCPTANRVHITERIIDKRKGDKDEDKDKRGNDVTEENLHQANNKTAFNGGIVKVYSISDLAKTVYGSKPKSDDYFKIFNDGAVSSVASCTTGELTNKPGDCYAGLPKKGQYLKIAKVTSSDNATMYIGHFENIGDFGREDQRRDKDNDNDRKDISTANLQFYTIIDLNGSITHRPVPVVVAAPPPVISD